MNFIGRMNILYGLIIIIAVLLFIVIIQHLLSKKEGFADPSAYKQDTAYTNQVTYLSTRYSDAANAKRPITTLLSTTDMPQEQQNFVNFYALGCRLTGYLGPMSNGYFDSDIGIQTAVNAGCRVFVLDIDYIDKCCGEAIQYFPRIVVRDVQGKFMIQSESAKPMCNSADKSNIKEVCDKINFYAFSSCQNNTDPVVIVLYFLRQPPGSYKSNTVLSYYSNVAKALAPFSDRLLTNELDGGTFTRQKQEGRLLINNIADYNGKVLIFSNANTNGFREVNTYSPEEDLDYLVNLRLSYSQRKMGVTENKSSTPYGILDTAENYMIIPSDRTEDVIEQTKLRWTMCLSSDPAVSVSSDTYSKIANTIGIHCAPVLLFDDASKYMFTDPLFKTYSFIPKPLPLRYVKPPIVTPAEPNTVTDAKGGSLRSPITA